MLGALLRFIAKLITVLIIVIIVFLALSVIPIDHTQPRDQEHYATMRRNLQALDTVKMPRASSGFSAGYGKVNITPWQPTSMAGSGLRRLHYEGVHDSIYVRCVVIGNGTRKAAIVSLDMLLVPPEVTAGLEGALSGTAFSLNNVYLSATHTHSSIGNWGKRLSGYLYSGPYDQHLVDGLVVSIAEAIQQADQSQRPAQLFVGKIPVPDMLYNRVAREAGTIDSLL